MCLTGALLVAAALTGMPVRADPCRLCAQGDALGTAEQPSQPVAIQVETSLNFDRLVLLDGSGGMARLAADGSRATSGVAGLTGRAMVGSVVIHGEPNRAVRVDLPQQIELWGTGAGRISIERVETDLPSSPRLDSAGRLTFRFGGELRIAGDAEGDFRGDVPITVEYL